MTVEEKRAEAIRRMEMLRLYKTVIQEFKDSGKLNTSMGNGALYWADDEAMRIVKDFEKKHNAIVYHLIRNETGFGRVLSILYVSDQSDEWEMDREDIRDLCPIAYVENLDEPAFSEFGSIVITPMFGGLKRVG